MPKNNIFKVRTYLLPAVIFAASFLCRAIYLYQLKQTALFGLYAPDAQYYDKFALKILTGDLSFGEMIFINQLYPIFLALIYRIFTHSITAVVLIQALLDSFTSVFIYLISFKIFKRKAIGILASLVYALCGIVIFYTGFLLSTTLLLFTCTLTLLLLLYAKDKNAKLPWFLSGITAGFAMLLRANILLFMPFLIFWIFLVRREERTREGALKSILLLAGLVLALAPFSIRNYAKEGMLSPFAVNGGISFYIGNNPLATGTYTSLPGVPDSPIKQVQGSIIEARRATGKRLTPQEASSYWFLRGLSFIKDNPARSLYLVFKKSALFWNSRELQSDIDYYFCRDKIPVLKLFPFSFGITAPFALLGLLFAARKRPKGMSLLVIFLFSYMLSLLIFFVNSRYRIVVLPIIIILASYAVYKLILLLKALDIKRSVLPLAALALSIFIVHGLKFSTAIEKGFSAAHTNFGAAYHKAGKLDEAMLEYKKILEADPAYAKAHYLLGRAYADKGLYDEAIAGYREAIRLDPDYTEAHDSLGSAYFKQGRIDEAMEEYKKAIDIDPDYYPSAQSNLGLAYLKRGMLDKAIIHFEKAVSIDTGYFDAYNNLGEIYLEKGRLDKAIDSLNKAISIEPGHKELHYNLGIAYSRKGLLNDAIAEYKKAIDIEPKLAEAHNNLGRVYLEQRNLSMAEEALKKAVSLRQDLVEAHTNLAKVYFAENRLEPAIDEFKKAFGLGEDTAEVHNNLGVLYERIGETALALEEYEKAMIIAPDSAAIYNNMALTYYNQQRYGLAIEYCDKAKERGLVNSALLEALKPYGKEK